MITLTEFLLARIAEDEAIAREEQDYTYSGSLSKTFTRGRVLAECEAKRRIVEDRLARGQGVRLLEYLALPYADHPDYDESWRP